MIYTNFTNFLKNRAIEIVGLSLVFLALLLTVSFYSYSPNDPTLIYGKGAIDVNNLLGVYGGMVADFLLQSLGLTSYLILITITSWGINLIINKELKQIKLKIFYLFLYIFFTCILIYPTYNNSFWLIDNGNSGFVGQVLYEKIANIFPYIKHEYTIFILILLSTVFFVLASNINFKYVLLIFKKIFNRNINTDDQLETNIAQSGEFINQETIVEKTQQAFTFEKTPNLKELSIQHESFTNFRLPSLDLLEKNQSKINLLDHSKNRPEGAFIEKILLDFGIDGKITKINNGPVVSLYEFEPAPGVKVAKIINLSDDIARNTSSTSARVSTIPGKNTVGIEIPNESGAGV
jgi:S-DNA-T family DNA segregation ATPase FtsK/SpoIIIE